MKNYFKKICIGDIRNYWKIRIYNFYKDMHEPLTINLEDIFNESERMDVYFYFEAETIQIILYICNEKAFLISIYSRSLEAVLKECLENPKLIKNDANIILKQMEALRWNL